MPHPMIALVISFVPEGLVSMPASEAPGVPDKNRPELRRREEKVEFSPFSPLASLLRFYDP
jgi:hypothetical protein